MYSWNRYFQVATHKNKNIMNIKPRKKYVYVKMRMKNRNFLMPTKYSRASEIIEKHGK
jgi:hypothetical protein